MERCAELGPVPAGAASRRCSRTRSSATCAASAWWPASSTCKDKETREWFAPAQGVAAKIRDEAFKRGVFVRLLGGGHVHAVAPPFIISKEQIDTVVSVLDESIGVVEKELGY